MHPFLKQNSPNYYKGLVIGLIIGIGLIISNAFIYGSKFTWLSSLGIITGPLGAIVAAIYDKYKKK